MQPLTKKQRRITLLLMIVAFVILGPWIIFDSFGYEMDDALGFIRTGGIYIHSDISGANIYVDGKFLKDNGLIIRNTLIKNLKPSKTYNVTFEKDGYRPWTKDIYVYPSIVSEARVLMLPEEILATQVFPFFDKDKNGTTTAATSTPKTKKGKYIPQNEEFIDLIILFDGKNPYEEVDSKEVVSKNPIVGIFDKNASTTATSVPPIPDYLVELGITNLDEVDNFIETTNEVSWLDNGNIRLHWTDNVEVIPYFYCTGVEERVCDSKIVLDWENDIEKFNYFPGRDDVWVVLVKDQLYAVEIDARSQRNIQLIYEGEGLDFVKANNGAIVVRDNDGVFELEL